MSLLQTYTVPCWFLYLPEIDNTSSETSSASRHWPNQINGSLFQMKIIVMINMYMTNERNVEERNFIRSRTETAKLRWKWVIRRSNSLIIANMAFANTSSVQVRVSFTRLVDWDFSRTRRDSVHSVCNLYSHLISVLINNVGPFLSNGVAVSANFRINSDFTTSLMLFWWNSGLISVQLCPTYFSKAFCLRCSLLRQMEATK